MTRLEQRLLLATGAVLLVGAALYVALGGLRTPAAPVGTPAPTAASTDGSGDADVASPTVGTIPGGGGPDDGGTLGGSATFPVGVRAPTGDDLTDPVQARRLLRAHLAVENVRWDHVAALLAVTRDPLDADVKAALLDALRHGNAAGVLQAYAVTHDGTVVPDILRILDDPAVDAHDRGTALVALSTIPGADPAQVVTGIESRLSGDPAKDRVYLQAIARTGGVEAARALVDAVARSSDPTALGPDVWRELDFRARPDAAEHLASVLRTTSLSPAALAAVVEMAGRTGAPRALVDSLLALDADSTPELVRSRVLASLAATGEDAGIERLLAVATKGADYASVAAKQLGDVTSASPAARGRLAESLSKTTDDNLRANLVRALGSLRHADAVPTFVSYVESSPAVVRTEAVIALGRIGPSAAPAVPALAKAADTGDEALRQHVAFALGKIATDDAYALLKQLQIRERSPSVKRWIEGSLRALDAARGTR